MRFTQSDVVQGVVERIQVTTGDLPPPSVLTALLALAPPRGQVDHAVASCESSERETTWHIVASAGRALITVDASSPRSAWTIDDPHGRGGLADDERLDAQLRPFGEVAAVQVVRTTIFDTSGDWSFSGQWRLTLRDGAHVDIRAGRRTDAAREACDEFALHIIEAIASA
jgi:hypothetical protein